MFSAVIFKSHLRAQGQGEAMTIGVLFVCTANICRSPMAEGVFRSMAGRAGLDAAFTVDSAGTFGSHAGEPPALPAIKTAARRGYDIASLRARQVVAADIARFDLVLAMDRGHLARLRRWTRRRLALRLLSSPASAPQAAPWTSPIPMAARRATTRRHST